MSKRSNKEINKMSEMRKKYEELYLGGNRQTSIKRTPLTQEENKIIDSVISTVEEKVKELKDMQNYSHKEKRKVIWEIISETKQVQKYDLPIEKAKKLYELMYEIHLYEIHGLAKDELESMNYNLYVQRGVCANKFLNAIEYEQDKTNNIEELQRLNTIIIGDLAKEKNAFVGVLKNKIEYKILKTQQQNMINAGKNDIPENIKSIIENLVNGNVDINKSNIVISEEAKQRVESKPKTKFSLTEEQEKVQIYNQIRTAIIENSDEYNIQNPESTIYKMHELCGGELGLSIRAVVRNLMDRKEFETAKRVCRNCLKNHKEVNGVVVSINNLRTEIKNAEVGDIVLRAINSKGTYEQDNTNFELIEKGLAIGNVQPSAVSLGKSKDGCRNITLADIWENKEKETKNHKSR